MKVVQNSIKRVQTLYRSRIHKLLNLLLLYSSSSINYQVMNKYVTIFNERLLSK